MTKYIHILILLTGICSCSSDDTQVITIKDTDKGPITVSFASAASRIVEGTTTTLSINLDRKVHQNGYVDLTISSTNASYTTDYTTDPSGSNGTLRVPFEKGASTINMKVTAVVDSDDDTESINIKLEAVSDTKLLKIGSTAQTTIDITDSGTNNCNFAGVSSKYTTCLDRLKEDELNVVSWNIEFFKSNKIAAVREIITNMHPDVIAVQEINEVAAFTSLGNQLSGWEAKVVNLGHLSLGYLYKTCEVTILNSPTSVLNGSVEPRPAVQTTIKHISGLEVTLLNIHLKCCRNGESRRRASSIALKNHLDNQLSDKNVIVLGDWNDDIKSGSPFTNFLNDANYKFADQAIADGTSSQWSYPSWPSHIDHILISNELFYNLTSTKTLTLHRCLSSYPSSVSDHRPIMATFK